MILGCLLLDFFFLHGFFFWKVNLEVVQASLQAVNKLYHQQETMDDLQQ